MGLSDRLYTLPRVSALTAGRNWAPGRHTFVAGIFSRLSTGPARRIGRLDVRVLGVDVRPIAGLLGRGREGHARA